MLSSLFKFINHDIKIEKIFLHIALFFGLIFVFVTPPFEVADEGGHFFRAYELSEGNLIAKKDTNSTSYGDYLPFSIIKTYNKIIDKVPFNPENKQSVDSIISTIKLPLNPEDRVFTPFHNIAVYSPVPYLPQITSIFLARNLNCSPIVIFYLARITTLLFCIAITYMAIKIIPFGKYILFTIALMPMTLFQSASASADVVINCLSFLTIALFLNYIYEKDNLVKSDFIKLGVLCCALSLCKQVYIPFVLLYFLIPVKKVGTFKKYLTIGASIIFSSLLLSLIWSTMTSDLIKTPMIPGSIDPTSQITFVLTHPFYYMGVLINTAITGFSATYKQFIGVLGWLDTVLPNAVYILYTLLLIFVMLTDGSDSRIKFKDRALFIFVFMLGYVLINTALYTTWNPVGNNVVVGIQGRYFIPMIPLILLSFSKLKLKNIHLIIVPATVITAIITLTTIIERYYLS